MRSWNSVYSHGFLPTPNNAFKMRYFIQIASIATAHDTFTSFCSWTSSTLWHWLVLSAIVPDLSQQNSPSTVLFFFGAPFPLDFMLYIIVNRICYADWSGVCVHLDVFLSILLVIVPCLQIRESFLQILDGHNSSWVVGSNWWTLQPLSKNLVASSDTFRVEGCWEDLALDL